MPGLSSLASYGRARTGGPLGLSALTFLGVALGYYATAIIGTVLSVPPSGFAIVWPATAFLIAVFLITPAKLWWLCIAAVLPTHFLLATTLQPNAPLMVLLTQVGGNLILALATVAALRVAVGKTICFDSLDVVLTYVLVAVFAVPALVNVLILSVHVATGWTSDLWLSWRQWMLSSVFPTATIPPALLLASQGRLTGRPSGSSRPHLELLLLIGLLFAFSFEAYGGVGDATHWPALFLVPIPFLLWAAARLGVGGTSLSLLVVASAIIVQALRHNGPFALHSPVVDVVSLQVYLIATSIPLVILASLMDERRRTANLLRRSDARMNVAASSTDTGLWQWSSREGQLWLTEHCRAMFKLEETADLTPYSFLSVVHRDDMLRMKSAIDLALGTEGPQPPQDYRLSIGGETRWLLMQTHSDLDENGKVRVSGVFRDVTDRIAAQNEADELRLRIARLREDERRRIAEELHDSTAQHLVAARLELSRVNSKVRSPATRALLASGLRSLHEALLEVRTFSYLLHPPKLGSGGLCGVLEQYVPGFQSRSGVRTSLRVSPRADLLPGEHQHAIFRIAQESLSNVHRHARARRASVDVRCVAGIVHLVVRDDGRGISSSDGKDLGERLCLGVGIPGMASRVEQLGGRFNLASGTTGTTVHVAIPLAPPLDARLH